MIISYKKLNLQKLTLYKKHESVQIYILCTKEKKKELLQHAAQKCLSAFAYRKFTHFTHVKLHTCEVLCCGVFDFFCYVSLSNILLSFSLSLSCLSFVPIHSQLPTHTLGCIYLGQDFEVFHNSPAHHGKQIYSFVAYEITLDVLKKRGVHFSFLRT